MINAKKELKKKEEKLKEKKQTMDNYSRVNIYGVHAWAKTIICIGIPVAYVR